MSGQRITELIEQIFWSVYRGNSSYTLNPAQWAALRFFVEGRAAKKTSSEFAKHHRTTRGTANQTVLALIRKGYLKRDISPTDHRSKSVSVTKEGLDALRRDPIQPLIDAVQSLDGGDRQHLETELVVLYERLVELQHAV
jgi:DNA-binding MarR family transcriptional regulator